MVMLGASLWNASLVAAGVGFFGVVCTCNEVLADSDHPFLFFSFHFEGLEGSSF